MTDYLTKQELKFGELYVTPMREFMILTKTRSADSDILMNIFSEQRDIKMYGIPFNSAYFYRNNLRTLFSRVSVEGEIKLKERSTNFRAWRSELETA